MRLYSYVITHDAGFAPNPFGGFCTLATCKPHIRLAAQPGDWVAGTGSTRAVGRDRLVYAAKIDEVLPIEEYRASPRFAVKRPAASSEPWRRCGDNIYFKDEDGIWAQRRNIHHFREHAARDVGGRNVLVANLFWYFGKKA